MGTTEILVAQSSNTFHGSLYKKNSSNFTIQVFGKTNSNNQALFHHFFAKLKDFQQI